MSNDTAILQLMLTPNLGIASMRRILASLPTNGQSLEDVVASTPDELRRLYRLPLEVARQVSPMRERSEALACDLRRHGVKLLAFGQPSYPDRLTRVLQDALPPLLFARGNLALLSQPSIAFAGSRHASEPGIIAAQEAALCAAADHMNVVSGYANGVDLAAHRAALQAGGTTTLVLAEGILQFRAKRELAEFLDDEHVLIISEFPPSLRWIARNAMQRNRTILGLADALLVIESGAEGGTFAAGETALKMRLPLFVLNYSSPPPAAVGNELLIQKGGRPLPYDGSHQPDWCSLFQELVPHSAQPPNLVQGQLL